MTIKIAGGCQCGAVRYEGDVEPQISVNCHCRACQKATGTGSMQAVAVLEDTVRVTGTVKYYDSIADSGNTSSRGFCPECGGRVLGRTTGFPGLLAIMVGSLDDPSWFTAQMNVHTETALPWVHMDADLPRFPGMPEMPGG